MLTVMAALISAVIIALLVSGAAILRGVTDSPPSDVVPSVDVPVAPTDCAGEPC